jgi:putative ABC transport system substrate-binding protein
MTQSKGSLLRNGAAEKLTRRGFLAVLGVASAWPQGTRAQRSTMPIVGFLSSGAPPSFAKLLTAFKQGLQDEGFAEGRNVAIKHRWAENRSAGLDSLAAQLVADGVTVIAATGGMRSAEAAKKATAAIPIVFVLGFDPVQLGLVASFNKPGGNITGITIITTELAPKRLSLLYDVNPDIRKVAILVNPESPSADVEIENVKVAAEKTGRTFLVLKASSRAEIDEAFAFAFERQVTAIVISADPLFTARRAQLVHLAKMHKMPVMYPFREFVDDGGLMSYGPNLASAYRRAGIYTARILKGTKPSELAIEIPTRFEFLINMQTAKALGLTIPGSLLATADEIVE